MKANDTSILPEDDLDHLEFIWPPNDLHNLQIEKFLYHIELHIKWKAMMPVVDLGTFYTTWSSFDCFFNIIIHVLSCYFSNFRIVPTKKCDTICIPE